MQRFVVLSLFVGLCLLLSACGSLVQYDLDGTWDFTTRVTESDFPENIGDTYNGVFNIIATGTSVTFTEVFDEYSEVILVAERSGNQVNYSETDTDELGSRSYDFRGTFTSASSFSGAITFSGTSETFEGETTYTEGLEMIMTRR